MSATGSIKKPITPDEVQAWQKLNEPFIKDCVARGRIMTRGSQLGAVTFNLFLVRIS